MAQVFNDDCAANCHDCLLDLPCRAEFLQRAGSIACDSFSGMPASRFKCDFPTCMNHGLSRMEKPYCRFPLSCGLKRGCQFGQSMRSNPPAGD